MKNYDVKILLFLIYKFNYSFILFFLNVKLIIFNFFKF